MDMPGLAPLPLLPLLALFAPAMVAVAPSHDSGSSLFAFELPPAAAHGKFNTVMRQGAGGGGPSGGPWGGVNAKDYGAVGDGYADDGPALQRAIDAATGLGRAMLLPAGHYRINATLSILSSARTNYAVPGVGYANHPLRLIGEGYALTRIIAAVKMHALLNYSSNSSARPEGAAVPTPTENQ